MLLGGGRRDRVDSHIVVESGRTAARPPGRHGASALTGGALQAEAAFGAKILAPIEVVGVESLGDSGLVLKARIKRQPGEQWTVGLEYNRRIKLAFDRAGIETPFPHLKVVLPEKQFQTMLHGATPQRATP